MNSGNLTNHSVHAHREFVSNLNLEPLTVEFRPSAHRSPHRWITNVYPGVHSLTKVLHNLCCPSMFSHDLVDLYVSYTHVRVYTYL